MKSGSNISGTANTDSALTGTCFRAGRLAFTHIGEALVEVIEVPEISAVGGTQSWFLGLATYRSELLPVTDFTDWAGLHEGEDTMAGSMAARQRLSQHRLRQRRTREGSRIKQRILVVRHPHDRGDQTEKIGLLVDAVSGHVLLEQVANMRKNKHELASMLRAELREHDGQLPSNDKATAMIESTAEPSPQLLHLVNGVWSSPAKVFLVDLQQLFGMDAFTNITVNDITGSRVSDIRSEALNV